MSKPLSEQVAELETKLDNLEADAISNLVNRHRLERVARNREKELREAHAEVDRLSDVARNAAREKDEWEANYEELARSVPREIGAGELREGQTVAAYCIEGGTDLFMGSLGVVEWTNGEDMRLRSDCAGESRWDWVDHEDVTIVLLADAPTTGYADDDHQDAEVTQWHDPQPEPVTAETVRNSEPGSTWDWFPANEPSSTWEFDGQSMRLHHQDGDISGYVPLEEMVRYRFTRSTAAPRGSYSDPESDTYECQSCGKEVPKVADA